VRLALGTTPSDLQFLVIRQGFWLALVDIVSGGAGAFGLTRYLQSMLYEVRPTDPATFAAVIAAWLACRFIESMVNSSASGTRAGPRSHFLMPKKEWRGQGGGHYMSSPFNTGNSVLTRRCSVCTLGGAPSPATGSMPCSASVLNKSSRTAFRRRINDDAKHRQNVQPTRSSTRCRCMSSVQFSGP
jgi:hypothetical protein